MYELPERIFSFNMPINYFKITESELALRECSDVGIYADKDGHFVGK